MKKEIINGFDFSSLPIKKEYICKRTNADNWQHYLWHVRFTYPDGFFCIEYKCGIGHQTIKNGQVIPTSLTNADIMHSLLMDSEAIDFTFPEWCDCFGYSSDSIKALKLYEQCLDNAIKLKKVFSDSELDAMREALQDY